jgi:glycosyltransferase involved in cell wall biosynthesis
VKLLINALFAAHPNTGTGEYLRRLTTLLAEDGTFDLHLAGPANLPSDNWLRGLAGRGAVGLHPVPALPSHAGKLFFEHLALPWLAWRLGPEVIHVPHFGPPLFGGGNLVVTVHDLIMLAVPRLAGSPSFRLYIRLAALGARRARLVLTDSACSARDARRYLGLPEGRIRVVPLAADPSFRPVRDPSALADVRARYGLEEDFILYLGGLDWRKNVAGLIAAFRRADLPRTLAVAGAAHTRNRAMYPDLADAAAGDFRVRFIGHVADADKPALYSAAAFFVYPSLYEGFGLPPLEAMACGTPAIVSERASLPEVTGDAALRVDPEDPAALTAALCRLHADGALRAQLAAAGLARAATFSWRRTAGETLAAYREVADD